MKTALRIIGVAAIAMGLLWLGQGIGLIDWPRSSFMLGRQPWAWRGAALAIAGAALLLWSRRR